MDQNQLADLMKNMAASPEAIENVQKLLAMSSEAMQLIKDLQTAKPEDRELAKAAFLKKQQEISSEYEKILAGMGMTKESLEAYVSDPKNFSPEQFRMLQSFKHEVKSDAQSALKTNDKPKKSKPTNPKQWISA